MQASIQQAIDFLIKQNNENVDAINENGRVFSTDIKNIIEKNKELENRISFLENIIKDFLK